MLKEAVSVITMLSSLQENEQNVVDGYMFMPDEDDDVLLGETGGDVAEQQL